MPALGDLLGRLDRDPGRRGKQFEHICKWFLTHDPVYAHELRQVWLWDEWPGRWGGDAGIDLVAEDNRGRLWAIQAKCYNQAETVTRSDINKFLSESGRAEFSFRLLIATTNRVGRIAHRTLAGQEKPASVLDLGQLEAAQVEWPRSPSALRAARLPPKRPAGRWAYQAAATKDVAKGFRHADRGQLIMACGTGKTLVAMFVAEKLAAQRTLILSPSLSLLAQTLRQWTANSKRGFEFLPVCSDATVTEPDAAVENTSDLGFPVTTDPAEIATFLRRRSGHRVVFATYQSSPEIAKAYELGRVPAFDLAIADEAHRCAGPASSAFATILDPNAIKARRRLFMTATPRYFTGRLVREAKTDDFEIASMENEGAFGAVFHRLSFGAAIQRDLLTDYQVAVVGVDDATFRDWAERGRFVTIDGTEVTDARSLAGQIGVAKAMRRYDLQRTITFHSRVKRAREFAHALPQVIAWMPARQRPTGQLWSDYASGEMPAGQRRILLRHLRTLDRGHRGLLANARCLAEGIDVPTLDGVAFIDPRRSEVDIMQAVGRAIRRAPNKTVGTVVIPVFIDTREDPTVALETSTFKPVWDVIKALRSHDDELGHEIDLLRRELGRQRRPLRRPGKIHLDLPTRVGADFARAFDVRVVEQTSATWEFWFGVLEQFVEQHGHACPTAGRHPAGVWVAVQRRMFKVGQLSEDRRRRLEALPGWSWDRLADQWVTGYDHLAAYVAAHGHTTMPEGYKTSEGFPLSRWAWTQRSAFKKGSLSGEQIRLLEALAGWTWNPRADMWHKGYDHLAAYVAEQGHCNVGRDHTTADGYALGHWATAQRSTYKRPLLTDEQIRRLEALPGWTWNRFVTRFETGYAHLAAFAAEHGTCAVPQGYLTADGYKLGYWVGNLRSRFKRGSLSNEQIRRLETLSGWTWTDQHAEQWDTGYGYLAAFTAERGHAGVLVKYTTADGYALGKWAARQRRAFKEGMLSKEQIRGLEALPGWTWNRFVAKWDKGFDHLAAYVAEHGDCNFGSNHMTDDGYALGAWASWQRRASTGGKLSNEQIRLLEALPGWTWDRSADLWEQNLQQVLAYAKEHGHSRVPASYMADGHKPGKWAATQRNLYRNGSLTEDQVRRLEALPGWTWASVNATKWETGFDHMAVFAGEHGHTAVPLTYKAADGYPLGRWAGMQRRAAAQGLPRLTSERRRRLEELPGWTWDRIADLWEKNRQQVAAYAKENGHSQVPDSYMVDGYKPGVWVQNQRTSYKKGSLTEDQIRRLESLPGWTWSVNTTKWETGYNHMTAYGEEHGHTAVPYKYKTADGYPLGHWSRRQRVSYKNRSLNEDQIRRLKALPGWRWT